MNLVYENELAFRSIELLTVDPRALRERLPDAWDEGMSLIVVETLPKEADLARKRLSELHDALNTKSCSYRSNAKASVHRRHDATLVQLAQKMMDVSVDLEKATEKLKGTKA